MDYISFPPFIFLPVSIILIDVVLIIGLVVAHLFVTMRNIVTSPEMRIVSEGGQIV